MFIFKKNEQFQFLRYKVSKSVTVGLGRFIVLNDYDGPEMAIKMYFIFFSLDYLYRLYEATYIIYMTAIMNFGRFALS